MHRFLLDGPLRWCSSYFIIILVVFDNDGLILVVNLHPRLTQYIYYLRNDASSPGQIIDVATKLLYFSHLIRYNSFQLNYTFFHIIISTIIASARIFLWITGPPLILPRREVFFLALESLETCIFIT